ncbi:MAG: hypothetical protein D9V47_06820 [Clostridia bacterium]|nr:MAG: hypothetical protein D9V47_06820 [Clostridia bacterium]
MPVLSVVDVRRIQRYVFGSNILRHNVGASALVEQAVSDWVFDSLREPHNVRDGNIVDLRMERDSLAAEVIYSGGGNAAVIFADMEEARQFARRYTAKVLLEAPGLEVTLAHSDPFIWETESLARVLDKIMQRVAVKKLAVTGPTPLLGLSVTAACDFTGLPAVGTDEEDKLVSAEVEAKTEAALKGRPKFEQKLNRELESQGYTMARDFDHFGRSKGESSYIGIIHTDGNGMSRRKKRIGEQFSACDKNREYILAMRRFSRSVAKAVDDALLATLQAILSVVERISIDGTSREVIAGTVEIRDKRIPFRPIVVGGDDVTLVVDGRLALSVAAFYLERFSSSTLADGKPAYARAGVAIVKTHYPFARAYALAEELCASAKKCIQERCDPPYNEEGLSALDWHIATTGFLGSLEEMRERSGEGKLHLRPLRLTSPDKDWRSWRAFTEVVEDFQKGPSWAGRRNKVKALRDALRDRGDAVKDFLRNYQCSLHLPEDWPPSLAETGWYGDTCGYFDAIEAMDFYTPLAKGDMV